MIESDYETPEELENQTTIQFESGFASDPDMDARLSDHESEVDFDIDRESDQETDRETESEVSIGSTIPDIDIDNSNIQALTTQQMELIPDIDEFLEQSSRGRLRRPSVKNKDRMYF